MNSLIGKSLRSQYGFALTAVLVTAAVASIVMLSVSSSIVYMYKLQKSVSLSAEQKDAIRQLDLVLSDQTACLAALGGEQVLSVTNGLKMRIKLNGSSSVTLLDGASEPEITPGLKMTSLRFRQTSAAVSAAGMVNSAGNPIAGASRMFQGKIFVGTKKSNDSLFATSYKEADFNMTIITSAANLVVACSADGDEGKLCKALGNFWNPFAAAGVRCMPKGTCMFAGTYSNAPFNKGGFNNPLTGPPTFQGCPAGYDSFLRGNISYGVSCGKDCVRTMFNNVYDCAICIDDNGARVDPNIQYQPGSVDFDFGAVGTALGL